LSKVDRLKPELQRWRVLAQPEIITVRRNEEWIGDDRMQVVSALPPLLESGTGEFHGIRRGPRPSIKVNIPIHDEPVVLPVAAQQAARVEVNDVVRQDKGEVLFLAGAHELMFLAEGEDIVADDVFAPVMLMEASTFGPVDDVVLPNGIGGAFVRI